MTYPDPRVTGTEVPEVEQEPKHDHEFGVYCHPACPRWGNPEPQADWEPQQEWFFTFGANHAHPTTGEGLGNAYVVIHGTCDSTRAAMFDLFGNRWSQQYMTVEAAGIQRFGLRPVDLPKADLPPFDAEVATKPLPALSSRDKDGNTVVDRERLDAFYAEMDAHSARLEAGRLGSQPVKLPVKLPVTPAEERTGDSAVQQVVLDDIARLRFLVLEYGDRRVDATTLAGDRGRSERALDDVRVRLDRIEQWARGQS